MKGCSPRARVFRSSESSSMESAIVAGDGLSAGNELSSIPLDIPMKECASMSGPSGGSSGGKMSLIVSMVMSL